MRQNSCGVEIDQRCINFIMMLEERYKVDIKNTADFVEIRDKWYNEGSPMPEKQVVCHRASKDVVEGNVIEPVAWNPLARWDRKKNPIRWEDQ